MIPASVRYSSSWDLYVRRRSGDRLIDASKTYGFDGANGAVHHCGVHLLEWRHVGCVREPIEYRNSRSSMYRYGSWCMLYRRSGWFVEDAPHSHKAEVTELRQHVTTRQAREDETQDETIPFLFFGPRFKIHNAQNLDVLLLTTLPS
jgi:hypothetical protein